MNPTIASPASSALPTLPVLQIGDHLVTPRGIYTHHGIYVGDGKVVHYSGFADWVNGLKSVIGSGIKFPIEEVTLADFELGKGFSVKPHANPLFSGAEIAQRAKSRIGEDRYCVARNNCEHFCEWCINNQHTSWQVRKAVKAAKIASAVSGSSLAAVATGYGVYQAMKWAQKKDTKTLSNS